MFAKIGLIGLKSFKSSDVIESAPGDEQDFREVMVSWTSLGSIGVQNKDLLFIEFHIL